jgi:hypothetical protein
VRVFGLGLCESIRMVYREYAMNGPAPVRFWKRREGVRGISTGGRLESVRAARGSILGLNRSFFFFFFFVDCLFKEITNSGVVSGEEREKEKEKEMCFALRSFEVL